MFWKQLKCKFDIKFMVLDAVKCNTRKLVTNSKSPAPEASISEMTPLHKNVKEKLTSILYFVSRIQNVMLFVWQVQL